MKLMKSIGALALTLAATQPLSAQAVLGQALEPPRSDLQRPTAEVDPAKEPKKYEAGTWVLGKIKPADIIFEGHRMGNSQDMCPRLPAVRTMTAGEYIASAKVYNGVGGYVELRSIQPGRISIAYRCRDLSSPITETYLMLKGEELTLGLTCAESERNKTNPAILTLRLNEIKGSTATIDAKLTPLNEWSPGTIRWEELR